MRRPPATLAVDRIASPIGAVIVIADAAGLVAVEFADAEARMQRLLERRYGKADLRPTDDPHGASTRLSAYFAGDLAGLDALPVSAAGTPFQQRIWALLRTIGVGTTTTYGALAARLGTPQASRAVGLANALNPVSIVVPCHRVIGSDASLTGYGGGLERKRWLLEHEGAALPVLRKAAATS
jgi:methylated-DNA-[protein]-cysteine S-methyltransferase